MKLQLTSKDIVAIDPAATRFAFAVFDKGVLTHCAYGKRPHEVLEVLQDTVEYLWVLESPQDYDRFAVAHGDLDRLRAVLQRLSVAAKSRGDRILRVTPHVWKGGVPKRIHHKRVWQVLLKTERDRLPDDPHHETYSAHDIHDAVALGVTCLQRVRRGGRHGR